MLAREAGCRLRDMEFIQCMPTTFRLARPTPEGPAGERHPPGGAYLLNSEQGALYVPVRRAVHGVRHPGRVSTRHRQRAGGGAGHLTAVSGWTPGTSPREGHAGELRLCAPALAAASTRPGISREVVPATHSPAARVGHRRGLPVRGEGLFAVGGGHLRDPWPTAWGHRA